jgi:SM-20-related protein
MAPLLQLNPALDRAVLAAEFTRTGRLQVRDVLTEASAVTVRRILTEETPWGLAWQAGANAPANLVKSEQLQDMSADEQASLAAGAAAAPGQDYAFAYHSYPLVTAYLERWRPGSPQERLLEELNGPAVLDFMREVSGIAELVKLDGQATLYAPGHFLWPHSDAESERGRRVAYVLNLTLGEWKPQWGGYLQFFDGEWDIEQAFRPRFNSLNLFRVPQWHSVSEVAAAAPLARYAITGWARDR